MNTRAQSTVLQNKMDLPDRPPHYPVLVILILICSLPSIFEFDQSITAYLFLLLTSIPFFHACFISRNYNIFKPVVLISIVYAIAYPVTGILISYYMDTLSLLVSEPGITEALRWSYRGFACFICSYVITETYLSNKSRRKSNEITSLFSPHIYVRFCCIMGFLGISGALASFILYKGVPVVFLDRGVRQGDSTIFQGIHYLLTCSYIFFFMYIFLRHQSKRKTIIDWMFYILLIFHSVIIMGEGSKARMFSLIISLLLPISLSRIRFSIKQGIIGVITIVLIYATFSITTNYRIVLRDSHLNPDMSILDTIKVQTDAFGDAIISSFTQYNAGLIQKGEMSYQIFTRLGSIQSFAYLLQSSGGKSPYEDSISSFFIPLFSVVPRTIMPNKPVFFHSGELASRFFGWEHGGISVTLIGSLFWSWGYYGICFGMIFIGFIFSFLVAKYHHSAKTDSWILYAGMLVILVPYLMDSGKTFHALITDSIRFFIIFSFLIKIILRGHSLEYSPDKMDSAIEKH
jgi:hypothetical protein